MKIKSEILLARGLDADDLSSLTAIGGSWGGISRLAREAEKSGTDKAKHARLCREVRKYVERIEAACKAGGAS